MGTLTQTINYCNRCAINGNITDTLDSASVINTMGKLIIKYDRHKFMFGYCDLLKISDLNDFHVCIYCLRYAYGHKDYQLFVL